MREGRFDADANPAVMGAATAALGVLPQLVLRLVTEAKLPFAAALPDRPAAAHALFQTLLFGIAGPVLRDDAASPQRAKPRARSGRAR